MGKNIFKMLIIAILVLIMFVCTKVSAVGIVSLRASNSSVNVGDTFTISVNLSGASVATLTIRVSVDTSKVEYISGPNNSSFSNGRAIYTWTDATGGENPITDGNIVTFTFKAKSVGEATFSINGDLYSPEEQAVKPSFSGTSVTIISLEEEKPPIIETPTTNTVTSTSPITPEPPVQQKPQEQPLTPPQQENINSGTTTELSSNANLKSLYLNVEGINPQFNKSVTTYYLVISNTVQNIEVTALPEDNKAKVSVTGNTNILEGASKINIIVTAQNGNKKTYTINITKTADPTAANANLENLAIENATLVPEFDANVTEYTTRLLPETNQITLLAVPQIEGANVQINANEIIEYGNNTITIIVTATNGTTQKIYTINAYKKTQEEQAKEELEDLNIISEEKQSSAEVIESEKQLPILNVIFIAVITLGVIFVICMMIKNYRKQNTGGK